MNIENPKTQKQKDKLHRLIELLNKSSQDPWNYAERALYHLLTKYEDQLPPVDGYFHKAFRQIDVTDDGDTDMAIYCLLHHSKLFWEALTEVRRRKVSNRSKHEKQKDKN
ncbi:MAG: hypothetical protein QQN41_09865 [Nitrosopumilus sp.]